MRKRRRVYERVKMRDESGSESYEVVQTEFSTLNFGMRFQFAMRSPLGRLKPKIR